MEVYAIILYILSTFGFLVIFLSMYLLIRVPTKLSAFSQFVVHGHDLASGINQIFFTVALQVHIIFPCVGGYTSGLLTSFNIMDIMKQASIGAVLFSVNISFSLLIIIQRAFAVTMNISKKCKTNLLRIYFAHALLQMILIPSLGFILTDSGEKGRQSCMEKNEDYPKEMDTMHGINLQISQNALVTAAIFYVIFFTVAFGAVTCTCGTVLVRSIRNQGSMTQSAQFLANQRRLTVSVIYFMFLGILGVGLPLLCVVTCAFFSLGNIYVSHCAVISVCSYPIFSPYFVLLSNADYRSRVNSIMRRACNISHAPRAPTVTITTI